MLSGFKVVDKEAQRRKTHASTGERSCQTSQGASEKAPAASVTLPDSMARPTTSIRVRKSYSSAPYESYSLILNMNLRFRVLTHTLLVVQRVLKTCEELFSGRCQVSKCGRQLPLALGGKCTLDMSRGRAGLTEACVWFGVGNVTLTNLGQD